MAATRSTPGPSRPRRPPATTPEAREKQLISLATDLAEKRLREGSATAQEVIHYLKMAAPRERLEREKLEHENQLLRAKAEAIRSAANSEKLFEEAIKAMQSYQGAPSRESDDED